jgi:hypothetical protein
MEDNKGLGILLEYNTPFTEGLFVFSSFEIIVGRVSGFGSKIPLGIKILI